MTRLQRRPTTSHSGMYTYKQTLLLRFAGNTLTAWLPKPAVFNAGPLHERTLSVKTTIINPYSKLDSNPTLALWRQNIDRVAFRGLPAAMLGHCAGARVLPREAIALELEILQALNWRLGPFLSE